MTQGQLGRQRSARVSDGGQWAHLLIMAVGVFAAAIFGVFGAWAFLWPESFFTHIATYPPFNLHLFHDAGVFQLGIAAGITAGLIWRDGLLVGLFGGAVGTSLHAVSHFMDADLGGRASDPYALSVISVLIIIATVLRLRMVRDV